MSKLYTSLVAKRDAVTKDEKGFTLIELLVVVLIIGVLAAIAVPIFITQQNQARDAGYKADLANAKIAYVSAVVSGETAPDAADLATNGYTGGSTITIASGSGQTSFCLTTGGFEIRQSGGVTAGNCT